ncbi:MAG: hypothetical protein KGM47_11220 [Acidobacteriota bacterium]|nr:hypothetical protein [Acidobacteriota bacterium]
MNTSQIIPKETREVIPVKEYVLEPASLISHLSHGWELNSAIALTPAEERMMVREPAQAVPESLAARIGKLRVWVVPYVGCFSAGDAVCFAKPRGESHTAVWVEAGGMVHLVLACREVDPHDTGFEFLASIAQLAAGKMSETEIGCFSRLLEDELRHNVSGEIDHEALDAKEAYLKARGKDDQFESYRNISLSSTLAEYMHGLWHDVQIRTGPEHLPVALLRERMIALSGVFPPNPGYNLFAREIERDQAQKT